MRSFKSSLTKTRTYAGLGQEFSEFYLNKSIIQVSMNMKQINHQKISSGRSNESSMITGGAQRMHQQIQI
jgi:hypothetical protein